MTQYEFRNKQLIKRAAEVQSTLLPASPRSIVLAAVTCVHAADELYVRACRR